MIIPSIWKNHQPDEIEKPPPSHGISAMIAMDVHLSKYGTLW